MRLLFFTTLAAIPVFPLGERGTRTAEAPEPPRVHPPHGRSRHTGAGTPETAHRSRNRAHRRAATRNPGQAGAQGGGRGAGGRGLERGPVEWNAAGGGPRIERWLSSNPSESRDAYPRKTVGMAWITRSR